MSAVISPDRRYRYRLDRQVAPFSGSGTVCFVMLNPSTADAEKDDPTIRRCQGFAQRWGFAELVVVNLFALRVTKPVHLWDGTITDDPNGPLNLAHATKSMRESDCVVAAWGAYKDVATSPVYHWIRLRAFYPRDADPVSVYCLGKTADGSPCHPLYVRADKELELWP